MSDAVSDENNAEARSESGQADIVDRLLSEADAQGRQLVGPGGLLTELTQRVLERALDAEMTDHLGYEVGDPVDNGSGNSRNGRAPKTVLTDVGPVEITVPRDRNSTFTPQIVPKRQRRLESYPQRVRHPVRRPHQHQPVGHGLTHLAGHSLTIST